MLSSFEGEVAHLLPDDPRIAAEAMGWESDGSDVMQQTLRELVEVLGSGQLKVADRVLDHLDGVNKTQTIRVKVSCSSRLMHEKAQRIMGNQQPIQLLNDANR